MCSSDDKGYWYNGVSLRQLASVETGEVQGESLSGGDIDAAIAGVGAAAMAVESGAEDSQGGTGGEAGKAEVTLVARTAEVTTEQPRATVTTVTRAAVVTTEAPKATLTEITRKADIETITN